MGELILLYKARLGGIEYEEEHQLEDLLVKDEKKFYFLLMYLYLIDKDLKDTVRLNMILCNAISLFCIGCNDDKITEYYSKYLNLTEVQEQAQKIYKELRILT